MEAGVSLGAIVRKMSGRLLDAGPLAPYQLRALRAIADCRTPALGGHRDRCTCCAHEHLLWNSCRNRHCPGCGGEARAAWLEAREEDVLDVPYFHAVFTIPEQLNALVLHAPAVLYAILIRAAGESLLSVARTRLRATLGVLAVLHTWGQTLSFHPHVHCVVTGGGLSLDGQKWVRLRKLTFLLAVKVLSRRFRSEVTAAVRGAVRDGSLTFPPSIPDNSALERLLEASCRSDWHAYLKKPFGGPAQVLAYLASYTHRIAISNSRIVAFDGRDVTFRWRDYRQAYASKTMTLDALAFLRRFAMHIVPPRFVRVRYFGFLANRIRRESVTRARLLIASRTSLRRTDTTKPPRRQCQQCHQGTMVMYVRIERTLERTWFDSS